MAGGTDYEYEGISGNDRALVKDSQPFGLCVFHSAEVQSAQCRVLVGCPN